MPPPYLATAAEGRYAELMTKTRRLIFGQETAPAAFRKEILILRFSRYLRYVRRVMDILDEYILESI